MPRLELRSAVGVIDLDEVLQDGTGFQALSGITGLGLPPIRAQYTSGYADGSRHQHTRYTHRDIDIPIYCSAENRDELREKVDQLLRNIDKRTCTLSWIDEFEGNPEVWELSVRVVGGGEWTMGEDTTGDRELLTVITFRAGDPMWRRSFPEQRSHRNKEGGLFTINNPGTTSSPPGITLYGPGANLEAIGPDGQVVRWNGAVLPGDWVDINFATRTAIDSQGRNRYTQFDTAPDFWEVPAGFSNVIVAWDASSPEFLQTLGATVRNYVHNPTFRNDLNGWTPSQRYISSNRSLRNVVIERQVAGDVYSLYMSHKGAGRNIEDRTTITGLVPGETYRIGTRVRWSWDKSSRLMRAPYISIGGRKVSLPKPWTAGDKRIDFEFTASDETMTLALGTGAVSNDTTVNTRFWQVYIVDGEASGYFSGNTADTAMYDYSWEGTPNSSKSVRTWKVAPDTSTTLVALRYTPRRLAIL